LYYFIYPEVTIRLAFLNQNYLVQRELVSALKRVPDLKLVLIEISSHPGATAANDLLKILSEEPCPILLTVNEWGLDSDGILHQFMSEKNMLHVNWFVDDPVFDEMMLKKKFRPSPMRIDFVSDRGYIPWMIKNNYNPFFLPLGTDPSIFQFSGSGESKEYQIVFVGNSYREQINRYLEKVEDFFDGLIPLLKGVVRSYQENVEYDVESDIRLKIKNISLPPDLHEEKAVFIAKQVASYLQRKDLIVSLVKRYPAFTVFGDDGWLVDIPPERLKKAGYYDRLADVYRKSEIVVDVNRVVIRDGFTQRIFDALACGSFVVTSSKPAVHEFFNTSGPLQEVVTFRNQCALTQQIDYYLEHKDEMTAIASRGQKKVLSLHTYDHRIRQMLSISSAYLKKISSKL